MRNLENMLKNKAIECNKLVEYGFKKQENKYIFKNKIYNKQFEIVVIISDKQKTSKLIDLANDEEYIMVDIQDCAGKFVGEIRQEYEKTIQDIINKCTIDEIYKNQQSKEVIKYIKEKYDDDQCVFAISKLLLNKELDGFTRDNHVRNKLGLIVPKEWLGSVVISGLDENSKRMVDIIDNISLENKNIVMKNINRIQYECLSNVIGEIDDLTKDIIELSKYIYEYYIERMRKEEEKNSGKKY